MRYRRKVRKRKSKRMFARSSGMKPINRRPQPMRGGIRL